MFIRISNPVSHLVSQKKLHKKPDNSYLQTVDYCYTIDGSLKKINDPNSIDDDFFAQELFRNDSLKALSHVRAWNGNITATKWQNSFGNGVSTGMKAYAYQYFKNDQIKEAKYAEGDTLNHNVGRYNEESISYDVNGNIKTLQRKGKNASGATVTIDNLAYTYSTTNTNALVKVEDSGTTAGFSNGATDAAEFTYDANGNIVTDKNKGITAVTFNSFNKPKQVTFSSNRILKYSYDASGVKIKMEEYQGAKDNVLLSKKFRWTIRGCEYLQIDDYCSKDVPGNRMDGINQKIRILANIDAA